MRTRMKERFGSWSFYKEALAIGIPVMLQALIQSLVSLIDSFMAVSYTHLDVYKRQGYYIARDSVRAILKKGMRTIYNTHMHKLAFDIDEINEEDYDGKAFSLVVHNEGEKRSYKIEIAPPIGKSFASDIARKYGVTYEMLTEDKLV